MIKRDFRIALRILPIVVAVAVAKVVFDHFGWDKVELNALYSALVTATVFLIGFLLAGTLADYKESEKLPTEIAARIETIADECEILYLDKATPSARECLGHLEELATSVGDWLHGRGQVESALDSLQQLNGDFLAFEPLTQPNFIVRLKQEQSMLRLLILRINTIRETSFVGSAYVIAEITSVLLIGSLLFANIPQPGAELFLLTLVAFVLTYMIALIKDLDEPFEYDGQRMRGSAEISLAVIDALVVRIGARKSTLDRASGHYDRR